MAEESPELQSALRNLDRELEVGTRPRHRADHCAYTRCDI